MWPHASRTRSAGLVTPDGPAVEHVRVDHRGADVVVPQQLLHGPDVASVFQEVGGEGVPERVRRGAFAELRPTTGVEHGALQHGLVKMMATALSCRPVGVQPRGGEDPLPGPFAARVRIFAGESPGQLDSSAPPARSAWCCCFTRRRCCARASLATAGRTVTRSLAPLPSRTTI